MVRLQSSGLPTWAHVGERRLAHIARVTSLLRAWGAAMRLTADEANAWIDAGTWHDALRDAPIDELRDITGDRKSPDGLLHGPAVAIKLEAEGERRKHLLAAQLRWSISPGGALPSRVVGARGQSHLPRDRRALE